jgi:peptide-methionine (S)-S-oxide reductase
MEKITVAGGCFWCVEAVMKRVKGVVSVTSGYMGGEVIDPTYDQVCSGQTGHAEVVQIMFDPTVITLSEILNVFWELHNPTTLNKQGNDIGTQYRSAIFYENEVQRAVAEASIAALIAREAYPDPIVTEVTTASTFYPAEGYHQDFYDTNRNNAYCRLIIDPKIKKLFKEN